MLFINRVID